MESTSHKTIHCVVVTPETTVLEDDAEFVAFPAFDGEVGVLPGRSPLVARLGPGELRLRKQGGALDRYFVDGGFGQVRGDIVTLLTSRSVPVGELDAAALKARLAEINAEVATTPERAADKAARLEATRAELRLAPRK